MNVSIVDLAPCKKQIRVEIEAQEVDSAFESMTREFQREARFPGFRPGKAPKEMVLRKYEKDIEEEAKRKLISDHYQKAVDDEKLDVIGNPDIEEIEFRRGKAMQFAATVETVPDFELPEYKGLPVKKEIKSVTDEDVERAINLLREQRAQYDTVNREAATGDIAVVNYKGTCEGKPITDLAPTAKGLTEKEGFWIQMESNSFIPGFADQLVGAKAGEKRTVNVDFPQDFVTPQLVSKKGVYEVEVVEVKHKVVPPLDDELAKSFGAESLEKLQEGVRRDLENELKYSQDKSLRNQLMRGLLDRVHFELPETPVAQETRNVIYDLVQENQKRGVSRETIEKQKEQIYSAASGNAKERVKASLVMRKIAENEKIGVSKEEIARRVITLAGLYQIPPDKFMKDLQKRNGMIEVYDQVMNEKVMDFLQKNAAVEEVPEGTLSQPSQDAAKPA